MGWVESPKVFCDLSETLMYVVNVIINKSLLVPGFGSISKIPNTGLGLPQTWDILTHIDCYICDLITEVQCGPNHKLQVFNGTIQTLKFIFLSFFDKMKYYVGVKNILAGGGGGCKCVK